MWVVRRGLNLGLVVSVLPRERSLVLPVMAGLLKNRLNPRLARPNLDQAVRVEKHVSPDYS